MNPIAQEYYNRVKDAVERNSSLGRLSTWLPKHTTLGGKPFSFNGHEFQIELVDCVHPNMVVTKCSQVGVSEVETRGTVGFLATRPNTVAIYSMPTVSESLKFAKSRIDPTIAGSKYLSSIMVKAADSSSFKQIGSSQLHMLGTFGRALISIPADMYVADELNFSNPEAVATAESRLSHSSIVDEETGVRGIRRKFSTPTLPGVGVSALFAASDQRYRLVKCKHCGKWSWPDFLHLVVVTGWDRTMDDTTYNDVVDLEARGLIDTAKLLCENCHNELTRENLRADYREWVAKTPHVTHTRGYAVSPFDIPDYHTPASLLRKKLEYKGHEGHFRNFSLGVDYSDASNGVMPDAVANNTVLRPEYPDSTKAYGCVLGCDIGRTSWLTIGRPVRVDGVEQLHIVWAEQIRLDDALDNLFNILVTRIKQFRVIRAVIDNLPYTDTIMRVQKHFPEGMVLPCFYNLTDNKLPSYQINDKDHVVQANRTKCLDELVKKINNNLAKFAEVPDLNIMKAHLQNMKRSDRLEEDGSISSEWLSTGPQHYFHSLNYLNMAASMVTAGYVTDIAPPVSIKQAFVGRGWEARQSGILTRI